MGRWHDHDNGRSACLCGNLIDHSISQLTKSSLLTVSCRGGFVSWKSSTSIQYASIIAVIDYAT